MTRWPTSSTSACPTADLRPSKRSSGSSSDVAGNVARFLGREHQAMQGRRERPKQPYGRDRGRGSAPRDRGPGARRTLPVTSLAQERRAPADCSGVARAGVSPRMSTVVLPVDLVADVAAALTGDGRFALAAELLGGVSTQTAQLSAVAGTLALAQGDTAAAATSFEHALELDAACYEARKGLADLAADLGDLDRAADCYEAVDTPAPVTIVIPVFNRLDLTKQCLEALSRTPPADLYEVIVVDNASTD